MQIFEIVEKTPLTKIPNALFLEIQAVEAGSVNESSNEGKTALVDCLNRGVKKGGIWAVPLNNLAIDRLLEHSLSQIYEVAEKQQNRQLMDSLTKFAQKILAKKENMNESARGREYNHLEDLVNFYGSRGIFRAADILEQAATNPEDLSIKWDGRVAVFYGRNQSGDFEMSTLGGWSKGQPSRSGDEIYNQIVDAGRGEKFRTVMGATLSRLFPLLSASTPKTFKGYVKGDLLFADPMSPKTVSLEGVLFTPNKVTYTVSVDSELGHRFRDAEAGIALHTYYTDWGNNSTGSPVDDVLVKTLSNNQIALVGPIVANQSLHVDVDIIDELRRIAHQQGAAIDRILVGRKGLADMGSIIYTYTNQMSREHKIDTVSVQGLLDWLPSSKVSKPKQSRIQEITQNESDAFESIFSAIEAIRIAKNDIISQLDKHHSNIQTSTDGHAGGEGYVSAQSKTKFVPRHIWSPA